MAAALHRFVAFARFFVTLLLHSIGTGLIGIFVAVLIYKVQILGYGEAKGDFLDLAIQAPPWRRMAAVTSAGLFGATAWYWLRGRQPAFVPVEVSMAGADMPIIVTIVNAMIQDIVVALGGSFGREAAPREMAAMLGGRLADLLKVAPDERKILVACGTGAGLAAVYSVPMSGVLYTLEHMLKWDISFRAVFAAVVTSCLSTYISSYYVPTTGLYVVPRYSYSWPSKELMKSTLLVGPLAGVVAAIFCKLIAFVRQFRPHGRIPVMFHEARMGQKMRLWIDGKDGRVLKKIEITKRGLFDVRVRSMDGTIDQSMDVASWTQAEPVATRDASIFAKMPAAFLILGFLSLNFPALLGNGHSLAEVAIASRRHVGVLATLFCLKTLVTAAAIGSGVDGGTLTPSVALGATLGAVLGRSYPEAYMGDPPPVDAIAVVTAAAFLGAATKSPCTGWCLLMEFAAQGIDRADLLALLHRDVSGVKMSKLAVGMALPMACGVLLASLVFHWLMKPATPTHMRQIPLPAPPVASLPTELVETNVVDAELVRAISEESSNFSISNLSIASSRHSWPHENRGSDVDLEPPWVDVDLENSTCDEMTMAACFSGFRWGLGTNACVTIGSAFSKPVRQCAVTTVSLAGIVLAALVGGTVWSCRVGKVKSRHLLPQNDSGLAPEPTSIPLTCWDRVKEFSTCSFSAAAGATVPLLPWALRIHHDFDYSTSLSCSVASFVVACIFAAAMDVLPRQGKCRAIVYIVLSFITVAAAATSGIVLGHYHSRMGIVNSIFEKDNLWCVEW